jgi:hypothetical protein
MEHNRATERNIPMLIFLMDQIHPLTIQAVATGPNAAKLACLKERLKTEKTVSFFTSSDDLAAT